MQLYRIIKNDLIDSINQYCKLLRIKKDSIYVILDNTITQTKDRKELTKILKFIEKKLNLFKEFNHLQLIMFWKDIGELKAILFYKKFLNNDICKTYKKNFFKKSFFPLLEKIGTVSMIIGLILASSFIILRLTLLLLYIGLVTLILGFIIFAIGIYNS